MTLVLEDLPYAYDALQPYLSKESFEFHHDKHHATYVTNGNNLLKGTEFEGKALEDIIVGSHGKNVPVFNNVAQHYNHALYWKNLKANGGGALPGKIEKAIVESFGSVDKFKEEFQTNGLGQFGSGWVWLEVKDGKLAVRKTANAENPLVFGAKPLAVADVWEHSYYIDYRNRRADYLKAFLENLVNWAYVEELYDAAVK
jgi:superoxide dismutase, Fe-Mn family